MIPWFTSLVEAISSGMSLSRAIANAHMLFNILGVLILFPFTGLMEKAINRIIPDKKTADTAFAL
jgi:phosphate:Na+ symporter